MTPASELSQPANDGLDLLFGRVVAQLVALGLYQDAAKRGIAVRYR